MIWVAAVDYGLLLYRAWRRRAVERRREKRVLRFVKHLEEMWAKRHPWSCLAP
jgi:hypothetical protein